METTTPSIAEPTAPPLPAGVAVDADQRLVSDVACAFCGYALRGASVHSSCPECGERVADSLRAHRAGLGDPRWVSRVRLGLLMLGAWCALNAAMLVCSPVIVYSHTFNMAASAVLGLVGVCGAAVALVAIWLVTSNQAGEPRRALHVVARGAAVAVLLIGVGRLPFRFLPAFGGGPSSPGLFVLSSSMSWIGLIAGGAACAAVAAVVAEIGKRAGAKWVARACLVGAWAFAGLAMLRFVVSLVQTGLIWSEMIHGTRPTASTHFDSLASAFVALGLLWLLLMLLFVVACLSLWRRLAPRHP